MFIVALFPIAKLMESTLVSNNWGIEKENVVWTHSWILLHPYSKELSYLQKKMDATEDNHIKWIKSVLEI